MSADSEAMGVDAMTYLCNLCAERIKNAPFSSKELKLPADVRDYKRKLKRLYLELVPPLISVTTLIAVTIVTLFDALNTLFGNNVMKDEKSDGEDELVTVMLFFSSLNLILDVINVTCFARADQAFGLNVIQSQEELKRSIRARTPSEDLSLLLSTQTPISYEGESGGIEVKEFHALRANGMVGEVDSSDESLALVNLNMCSAWTVRCLLFLVV